MGEGLAMRHTLIRRVEDAEELGPQEPPPWVERGWTPLPLRLHVVGLLRAVAALLPQRLDRARHVLQQLVRLPCSGPGLGE